MAVWGIGAHFENQGDMTQAFITVNVAAIDWSYNHAPALHHMLESTSIGDVIYIKKAYPPGSDLIVKAVGLINCMKPFTDPLGYAVSVKWLWSDINNPLIISPPNDKLVRTGTLYREYNSDVIRTIFNQF